MDFIPTRASLLKKTPKNEYQEVSFCASKKPKKEHKVDEIVHKNEKEIESGVEFDIRKAKPEIIKLGMSGFDPVKKEEAKVQMLIKLGAKPPKNKYKNYKQLMSEKKLEKEKLESERKLQQLGKNNVGRSTAKGKSFNKKRRKESILDIYGKIVRDTSRTENRK